MSSRLTALRFRGSVYRCFRMMTSLKACSDIIGISSQFLLTQDKKSFTVDLKNLNFQADETRFLLENTPLHSVIPSSAHPRRILLYNSLPFERSEVTCVTTQTGAVRVQTADQQHVPVQVTPEISKHARSLVISGQFFEVCFLAKLPPLGVAVYFILQQDTASPDAKSSISSTSTFNIPDFPVSSLGSGDIKLKGASYEATFERASGFLKNIKCDSCEQSMDVQLDMVAYGTADDKGKSGAYLFIPDGPAKPITAVSAVAVVDGPLYSGVYVAMTNVLHHVRLLKTNGADATSIQVMNFADISQEANFELGLRLRTGMKTQDGTFFTDENGFHMLKRKYLAKLPIQGNFYPMPAAAYVEDAKHRVTILSGQPLGVGSLESGELQVILDRRLLQDDNRGLFQSITDNRHTSSAFRILLEPLDRAAETSNSMGYLSLSAHYASMTLLHSAFVMFQREPQTQLTLAPSFSALLPSPWPCDVHLLNMRMLQGADEYAPGKPPLRPLQRAFGLVLHRFATDCRSSPAARTKCYDDDGQMTLSDVFNVSGFDPSAKETTLSLVEVKGECSLRDSFRLKPMELKSFKILFRNAAAGG